MRGLLLMICITLTAIGGVFCCIGEGDWIGLSQILLIYFGVLLLEDILEDILSNKK